MKDLSISNDFNLATPIRGRKYNHRGYKFSVCTKDFDDVLHNWWVCNIEGNNYGNVYLTKEPMPYMKEALVDVAKRSIDKLLDEDGLMELKQEVE